MKRKGARRGFTLVELIVVIAIIGVLAAVLIPTFSGAIDSARQASDKSDVTHMNQELMIYKIQENVSSIDYHSALLWLTTNGYSLESSAKGYAYWFDEDAEQLVYAQVDEAISNANVASATGDGTDGIYDDPGKIAENPNLTLIDRRTDNPIITAVNGIRNLVQEASSKTTFTEIVTEMGTLYDEYIAMVEGNEQVTDYLENFDPDTTLYITENGVYSGANQDSDSTATTVVFSDTLRVIDKLTTGTPTYQINSMDIELPKTVSVVMNGALSSIVPATGATVTIAGEKAQFIEGSLNQTVKDDSSIQTIELNDLAVSGGSIDYTVQYAYKEAVIQLENGARRTFRVKLENSTEGRKDKPLTVDEAKAAQASGGLLKNNVTEYTETGVILREYLVPTFTFTGSFTNVSGISIQMKKDGDLVVFYGITYGKNGTISQVVTFGYWTDITQGNSSLRNDQYNNHIYQYTVSDPLRGYVFEDHYEKLVVTAYSNQERSGVELSQRVNGTTDTAYRTALNKLYYVRAYEFTVSSDGLVLYAEYIPEAKEDKIPSQTEDPDASAQPETGETTDPAAEENLTV